MKAKLVYQAKNKETGELIAQPEEFEPIVSSNENDLKGRLLVAGYPQEVKDKSQNVIESKFFLYADSGNVDEVNEENTNAMLDAVANQG